MLNPKVYQGLNSVKGLSRFTAEFPEFGECIENLVNDTDYSIRGFLSAELAEDISVHVLKIKHPRESFPSKMAQDRALIESRLEDFEDEGNPKPSIIWFYNDGIITFTGYY